MKRAESLPTKSINQYRTRDVFAYLALRYCSSNSAARTNAWVEKNAIQVVLGSTQGSYLRSPHFKQIDETGAIEHRDLFVPGAAEALAESALLAECAKYVEDISTSKVFSYRLTDKKNRRSCFEPYMVGLNQRQARIADVCRENPNAIVAYIDIEKFYPSVSIDLALGSWMEFCSRHSLDELYADLGQKLIRNYNQRSDTNSIITGPMFSYFIANLVLEPVDKFASTLPAQYLRYVDDMTLIGTPEDVENSITRLTDVLNGMGLAVHPLHSPKTLIVPASDWLSSAADFSQGEHSSAWMRLVGDIKKLLLFDKTNSLAIEDALQADGFRLPIPDYASAVDEASSFQKSDSSGSGIG